ncbi:MAG: succinylglutamate desuccinylase/aspartoacylase family protein [Gammaproteobacteria bacterium]|nr:succinylglutamate desuccinylase/aspartoacylase family protein [Gammaproteobacteria bacterium]
MLKIIDSKQVTLVDNPDAWLKSFEGPTVIEIAGRDQSRWRIVSTLIHGNEPSGFIAAHRYLLEKRVPATNVAFIISSVRAARYEQLYQHRYMPGEFDLNRRFGYLEVHDSVTELARQITEYIREKCPSAVVDLHNTSGRSPAFAVSISEHPKVQHVASLFVDQVIITQLNVGALMEQNFNCPVVTIECGGSKDKQSHENAYSGLCLFAETDQLDSMAPKPLAINKHPIRVTVKPGISLGYGEHLNTDLDMTLKNELEEFNFTGVNRGTCVGWLNRSISDCMEAISDKGINVIDDLFELDNHALKAKQDLKCFMATRRADIALSDCLFYTLPMPD